MLYVGVWWEACVESCIPVESFNLAAGFGGDCSPTFEGDCSPTALRGVYDLTLTDYQLASLIEGDSLGSNFDLDP